MKKILCLLIVSVLLFTGCGKSKINTVDKQRIKELTVFNDSETVKVNNADYESFVSYLNYDNIECPYNELFGIPDALKEKQSKVFDVEKHSYDFFLGGSLVDSEKLYDVVKKNNEKYMEGVGKHFNKKLSTSKLKECCEIVADTLNWGIENIEDIDLNELGCILGNLKILNRGTMNLGTFNDKNDLLNISPKMIKSKKERNGNSNMYEITVSHEAMHILQCRCTDIEQGDDDSYIGTSYYFENLEINPMKNSWLYEASAELNATLRLDSSPTTYQYMIDNLETINLATVLNDNVRVRQLEKLCFTQDEEALYKQLEFSDKTKAIEFLYVVELLRNKPEDFKKVYENIHGAMTEEYNEFLKKTYNPYFVEVTSKLFYKNLALKLTQDQISLNDVFFLVSLYELDLLKDIPLDNDEVRKKYNEVYIDYVELQKTFFDMIQKNNELDIAESFMDYQMIYGSEALTVNAELKWIENDKKEYLLHRSNVLFDMQHRPIISITMR